MKTYRKPHRKPLDGPPLFSNNARRRAGLPTHRKTHGRRYRSRKEVSETISAFLDYCENVESYRTTEERYTPNK